MNVEEKVATLEALLVRVKSNAAKPRPLRKTDDVAAVVVAKATVEEAPKAAPVAAPVARVVATPAAVDPWDALVEATSDGAQTVPARPAEVAAKPAEKVAPAAEKPVDKPVPAVAEKPAAIEEKPAVVEKVGTTPKAPPVIPATPKTPARPVLPAAKPGVRPEAPKMGERGEKLELTATASVLPKVDATAPKVTATGSALPKITPDKVTGSALPKVTATGSALPKVTPDKVTGSALPKVTPAVAPKAAQDKAAVPAAPATASLKEEAAAAAAALKAEMVAAAAATKAEMERARAAIPKLGGEDEPTADDDTRLMSLQPLVDAERALVSEEVTADEETRLILPHLRPDAEKPKVGLKLEPKTAARIEPAKIVGDKIETIEEIEQKASETVVDDHSGDEKPPEDETDVDIGPEVAAQATAQAQKPEGEDGDETQLMEPRRSQPELTSQPSIAVAPTATETPIPRLDTGEPTSPSRRFSMPSIPEAAPPRRVPQWTLAITAAALVGAAVFVGLRNGWFESIIGPMPGASATPSAKVVVNHPSSLVPVPPPKETASVAPVESAALPPPSASAATSAVAPTVSASAPAASASQAPVAPTATAVTPPVADGDGSNLSADRGYVIITSAQPASVYLGGVFLGLTNTKLETTCGAKYARLGAPPPAGADKPVAPAWISEGKSIIVACQKTTTQAM